MSRLNDIARQYPKIFKRISLDEVDIIARGEQPKHSHFVYIEDLNEIITAIKEMDEEDVIKLIAKKIKKLDTEGGKDNAEEG